MLVRYSYYATIRYSTYNKDIQTTIVLFTRNVTQGWLIFLSCPFIVQHNQSNERCWNRRFVFSPSRELYRDHLLFGLLGSCSMYLLVCICIVCTVYILSLVAFAFVAFSLSISFILIVFILFGLLITSSMYICVSIAFVLSFVMLTDIRPFPFA